MFAVSSPPKPPLPSSAPGCWDSTQQTAFPGSPFWPASCQEERDNLPALVSVVLAPPETPASPRPSASPPPQAHPAVYATSGQHPPPRGSAPSWLGRPRPQVQATPVLPWAPRGPRVVPLSCGCFVLLAPTPGGQFPG